MPQDLPAIENLDDDALRALIEGARKLLEKRDRERKQKALADAKALLEAAGLSVSDLQPKKSGGKKKPARPTGQVFTNPADASQTYTTGRGRPPKWFSDMQKAGAKLSK